MSATYKRDSAFPAEKESFYRKTCFFWIVLKWKPLQFHQESNAAWHLSGVNKIN